MKPSPRNVVVPVLACILAGMASASQAVAEHDPPPAYRVERNLATSETIITFEPRDGRIGLADVAAALAEVGHVDGRAVRTLGFDNEAVLSLDERGIGWELTAANLVLGSHIRFYLKRNDDGDRILEVRVDRAALADSRREMKEWLREFAVPRLERERGRRSDHRYGLLARDDRPIEDDRVVVLVHGLHADADHLAPLGQAVEATGVPVLFFAYPNDQSLRTSARMLAGSLAALQEDSPETSVTLVTHSMGGLVAREAVENPELDPANVDRLIMIACPNQGSYLAYVHYGADLWEHVIEDGREDPMDVLLHSVDDGLSEAAHEIRPTSSFLATLNGRPRNPRVSYTLILGTRGPMSVERRQALRNRVARVRASHPWLAVVGSPATWWLDDLDEVVDGRGDGAVAVERGKLDGVDDVVMLPFAHTDAFGEGSPGGPGRVVEVVLDRIAVSPRIAQ